MGYERMMDPFCGKRVGSRNIGWLEQQFHRIAQQPKTPTRWEVGTEILFRGELVRIGAQENQIIFGTEQIKVSDPAAVPIIEWQSDGSNSTQNYCGEEAESMKRELRPGFHISQWPTDDHHL